jgi:phospholipid/cholesterol/gamma-HCH transport system substrate-binding protein
MTRSPRRRIHRRRANAFYAGLGVVAVTAMATYLALTAPQGLPWSEHTVVRVAFANTGQLDPGADVRQNSVRVGSVRSIDYHPGQAVVTLALDGDQPVYRDAHAAMWDQSALGQKFVELDPGHPQAGELGADELLPAADTESATDIDGLLNVLDAPTRAALASTFRQVGLGMAGQGDQLNTLVRNSPQLLSDVGSVSRALAAPRTDLGGLFHTGAALARQFTGRTEELTTLVQQSNATLSALNTDQARPLSDSIAQLPATLTDFQAILDSLQGPVSDARTAVQTLRPGTDALGTATPDVRAVFRDAPRPLRMVPDVSDDAEPAIEALTSTFSDAKPLAPRLSDGFHGLRGLLAGLAPYSPDIRQFFTDGPSIFKDGENPSEHYLDVSLGPVNSSTAAGVTPCSINNYPEPGGGALRDHAAPGAALVCTTGPHSGPALGKGPAAAAAPLPPTPPLPTLIPAKKDGNR